MSIPLKFASSVSSYFKDETGFLLEDTATVPSTKKDIAYVFDNFDLENNEQIYDN